MIPRRVKMAVAAVGGVVAIVVALYAIGVIGVPTATVADPGDWESVDENETEVVTTVTVNNPNPLGIGLGRAVVVDYDLQLNNVVVAEGRTTNLSAPPGESTATVRTDIQNAKLAPWWRSFVRENETVRIGVDATVEIDAGISAEQSVSFGPRVELDNRTPVIDGLSRAANRTEGTYGVNTPTGTVGYEIERAWATWGPVNESRTTVRYHYVIRNPNRVPIPAVPDGFSVELIANDVGLLQGDASAISPRTVGRDETIPPRETQTVVFDVAMDNDRIDDWFRSHVRRDELTTMESRMRLLFEVAGRQIRVPQDGPSTYACDVQTAILVDNETSDTTCASTVGGTE
ncbi:hypothetical protein BRD17_01980 [Halobacteriales archaeon SW_7_68_16]|nr:MAG: hypothetical protein BRD17_01980 [Halobacteriales archaeon SW_7_68_16]